LGRRNMVNTEERADTADRADDLIPEESELMQRALKRLSPKESYDRVFRMRRAFQVHLHEETPKTARTRLIG
jgi:ubiquinol-cytochrome c reductase subunit 7